MTTLPVGLRRAPAGLTPPIVSAALIVLAAIALLAVVALGSSTPRPALASAPVPVNPAIEAKWGIRVTQVAATADGGLVDFRFVVLDPEKASAMMSNVDNLPVLRPDGASTVINSTAQMGDDHTLRAGETYFLLYRNEGGIVQPGTSLTVLFGDLTIEHVIAR